jgi:hypothetical protein
MVRTGTKRAVAGRSRYSHSAIRAAGKCCSKLGAAKGSIGCCGL